MVKKLNKTWYLLFVLTISFLACIIFCLPKNTKSPTFAEGENQYFSVTQYSQYNSEQQTGTILTTINNGEVAYVSAGNAVVAQLMAPDDIITTVQPSISLNGTLYSTIELENMGIYVDYGIGNSFRLTSLVSVEKTPYGKYDLTIDYILNQNGNQSRERIVFSYYVLPLSNYYSGTAVSTIVSNAYNVIAGATYDRAYQYQYQYTSGDQTTNALPSITYDKTNFALQINKTFRQIKSTQTISYDGQNLLTTGSDLVIIVEHKDSNLVTIYFNDLGIYTINYTLTYIYNGNVDILQPSTTNTTRRVDCIEIFGYQLFYSDITTSTTKEFKTLTEGTISNPTDVTYLSGNNYMQSLTNGTAIEQTAIQNILNAVNTGTITVQSTNQQPIQFDYNVEIFNSDNSEIEQTQSGYWIVTQTNGIYSVAQDATKYDYDNSPITEAGVYLFKLVYKNNSQINGISYGSNFAPSQVSQTATEQLSVQWFLFEITRDATQMSVLSNDTTLYDGAYTNDSVTISKVATSSIFDATTKLEISFQANYTGPYTVIKTVNDNETFTVSENGNYIATMYYGKNLIRSYSTTFTIDNNPIENIQIYTMNSYSSNYYYRDYEVDFLTNQPVAVSWNEKTNGSKITAKYKFIPLVADTNTNFSSEILKQYQSYGTVPVEYYFDYDGSDLTAVDYANTQEMNYIPSTSILSQAGMYIFYISDSAGNEKYFSFIIDNTQNKILQEIDGEFVEPTDLNILSSDVTIYFGQYKVIRFEGLATSGSLFTGDEWLANVLNSTDIYQNYFDLLNINTKNTYFVRVAVDQNVLLDRSDSPVPIFIPSEQIVNNSYTIHYTTQDEQGNEVAVENDYIFYTRDASNTKMLSGLDEISVENYLENYSGTHIVRISSDASRTMLVYTKDNSQSALIQDSYTPLPHIDTNTGYTQKDRYFRPTNVNTLSDSGEILTLSFNPTPEEGSVEVQTITYTFTPFSVENVNQSGVYTYVFGEPQAPVTIYSATDSLVNVCTQNEDGTYSWQVNTEYVASGIGGYYQTRPGKYTITRTYALRSDTMDKINDTYDYMVRTFTFIIDRNEIIERPSAVDSLGNTFSYVGESIKIQVLEGDDMMFYKDVYLAYNDPTGENVILTTNKLPVFVYIPAVKYGYSLSDGSTFVSEDSINSWTSNSSNVISSYALSAEIKYSYERSTLAQSTTIYRSSSVSSDGYLVFNDSTSGRAFTQVGFYQVTIRQGYAGYGDVNEFSFVFEITESTPSFTIVNPSTNAEYNMDGGVYYTNDDKVRLTWNDPENEFMARIDKSDITYRVNGVTYQIPEGDIITSGLVNYVDVDLSQINGAYNHNSTITFNMHYEGRESDYNQGQFSTSRSIKIDIVAPTENLNRLISLNGVNTNDVRTVVDKYNTSKNEGLYRYYSFAVDVSQIQDIIDVTSYTNGEAYNILYRYFEIRNNSGTLINTKYVDIYTQETSVTAIENSTNNFNMLNAQSLSEIISNLSSHATSYIEIVEIDMAGNITVYTIYLTNLAALEQTALTPIVYENNSIQNSLTYGDLNNNIDIYAKSKFEITSVNLFDYAYSQITINGVSYLKTPYSNGNYYNLSTYNAQNPSQSETLLSTFAVLSPSAQKQNVVFSLVPYFKDITFSCSVLNTSLSVIHTSTTGTYQNEEGILIKIPASTSQQDATIYAITVEIVQYVRNAGGNLVQSPVYSKGPDYNYFSQINASLDMSDLVTSTYVNYIGSTYLKISIISPTANRYYRYNVVDNFGDNYPISNIYGSEVIENELTSEVDIVENYENGQNYYYSTKNISFRYNIEKDIVVVTATTSLAVENFNLSLQADRERFESSGYGRVVISQDGIIHTVQFYAPRQDMVEGIVGGEINFTLNIYEAIAEIATGQPYRTLNLVIYNIIPQITLLDNSNNSQNGLFNHDTMYGNEIRITYRETTGRIPVIVYLMYEDGTTVQIDSGYVVSQPQTYSILIKYLDIFTDPQYDTYLDFTISDNDEDFYQVIYHIDGQSYVATSTGSSFTYSDANNVIRSITTHYILNTSDFDIIFNTEQDIKVTNEDPVQINGYTTHIYTISNAKSQSASVYFSRTIAITIIPQSTNILSRFSYYTSEGTLTSFDRSSTMSTFAVGINESNYATKRIAWQSYYGIPENYITVEVKYGDNQTPYYPRLTTENGLTTMTLSSSGTYYLTFKDVAGNVHMFTTLVSTYTIRYLRSVIFYVNGESPINNAVYDSTVTVTIPQSTLGYYDSNAQPRISVFRNGEEYTPTSDRYNRTFTFDEAGLYKVTFSASVTNAQTGIVTQINEEPIYFLIIRPNESRWSMEFSQYSNYYVESVIKDDVDITQSITNENMGGIVYKTITNQDGTTSQRAYLTSFLISINDAVTGSGHYTVTINTDNEFGQKFTYSFWINNKQAPITVSVKENTSTSSPIKVSFNTQDLLTAVGDCVLKIDGMNDVVLNTSDLADGNLQTYYEYTITGAGDYNIQLVTESGKLLYSYHVTKTEPLNTVSIILIVVSCIVVVGLTILFILLRKRMKIK